MTGEHQAHEFHLFLRILDDTDGARNDHRHVVDIEFRLVRISLRDPAHGGTGILREVRRTAADTGSDTVEINLPVIHKGRDRNAVGVTRAVRGGKHRVIGVLDHLQAFGAGERVLLIPHRHVFRAFLFRGFSKSGRSSGSKRRSGGERQGLTAGQIDHGFSPSAFE